ncbi:excinuclease ABC subunit A, partial [Candidatus Roizmanbacteria bacterium CG_4_10_14_3_um_filter_33_21]
PLGACEKCKGLGTIYRIDPDLVINKNISINEGGIIPYEKMFFSDSWHARIFKQMCEEEKIDLNKKISDLSKDKIKLLLYGSSKTYQVTGTNRFGKITGIVDSYFGVIKELERRFFESVGQLEEIEVNRYVREDVCPVCDGKRLKPEILAITIDEKNIVEVGEGSIKSFYQYFNEELNNKLSDYEISVAKLIIKEIKTRLLFLINVGLSYLTINRPAKTLSGGELQRIRLASQIGSGLTGVLYVLDEPSIGLHPKDVNALINTLIKLRDLGNSIVVVEHDKETIMKSDYSIELGPMAGRHGGRIIFSGTVNAMLKEKKSLTGRYLNGLKKIKMPTRELVTTRGFLDLKNCTQNNLKKISVRFPLGNLICVTGVSGSGKSTLLTETLYPALKYYLDGHYQETMGEFSQFLGYQYVDRVYLVNQGPIGRTPRSNPATYIGFFDEIRALYSETIEAKAKGFKKGRFSFNVKGGRCEKCQGAGLIRIQMQFLPDVYVKCDVCNGQRYNQETLEITYRDKNIYDVLKMTVDEATIFFQNYFFIYQKLVFLQNVGLGYIELGQAAPTFSGGEAQRIKLANELSRRDSGKTVYILDEPTTGLHFYDIEKLLHTLYQLVEKGNTVILIEHNVDVIKNSQYVIDLGPGPGDEGGNVVYQGELEGLRKNKKSYTAEYL